MKTESTTRPDTRVSSQGKVALPILEVSGLSVGRALDEHREGLPVNDVSFAIQAGTALGILGESGAGKTTLALALLQLLPRGARIRKGSVRLRERELVPLDEAAWRRIRGVEMSLINQDSAVLNPVLSVGTQIAEVLHAHRDWKWRRCREEARAVLEIVGLTDDGRIFDAYPHQLSGGQRQRVSIALALACDPALVIADEPTASLDSATARDILGLFARRKAQSRTAFLLISHEPAVLAALADRVVVMYAGQIIEEGRAPDVLERPLHPYTRELLRCQPGIDFVEDATAKRRLPFIPGSPPDVGQRLAGCPFEARCADRMDICLTCPPRVYTPAASCLVRCHAYGGEQ